MQLISDHLLPGKPVWDVCCDHGYLGLSAYKSGNHPAVHFVDRVRHIIDDLKQNFEENYFEEGHGTQAFFFAQSAEHLEISMEGSVVIAGVGAFTIEKIVTSLQRKGRLKAQRLILGPQSGAEKLKQVLCETSAFDYRLSNEDCKIEERGRVRKLLILERK